MTDSVERHADIKAARNCIMTADNLEWRAEIYATIGHGAKAKAHINAANKYRAKARTIIGGNPNAPIPGALLWQLADITS